jgi:serine/threonine protein kinase
MWSFGVVLYELSTAYKPTAVKNYRYGEGPIPFRAVDWRKRDKSLQDLISACLEMDPTKRILPNEALMHPWFTEETD